MKPLTPCTCITAHDRAVCVGWRKPTNPKAPESPREDWAERCAMEILLALEESSDLVNPPGWMGPMQLTVATIIRKHCSPRGAITGYREGDLEGPFE